jgi:hypothetical protein
MELTAEQRQRILDEIHQREFLEKQAITEDKIARQAESERQHREALAVEARKREEERKERLTNSLTTTLKLLQDALEAFQDNDERRCYILLCKADPFFIGTKHQLNQTPERPTTGSLPTVRVKANNSQGWMIINAEDLTPIHEILEDA